MGRWEDDGAECKAVQCAQLPPPGHGNVLHVNKQGAGLGGKAAPWGGGAIFACHEGHTLVGAEVAACLENGTWSESSPQCQSKITLLDSLSLNHHLSGMWCPQMETPSHGFMMGVGRQFGDVVRFACQQGHRLFGSQEVVCGARGDWSGPVPRCHRIWCDPPVLGPGLRVLGPRGQESLPHRARLRLECMEGHTQRGELDIVCQANARWSRPEGACHSE